MFEVKGLHVSVDKKKILNGINLSVDKGEIHAIMGKNGSGKSTFAHVLMGNPRYSLTKGQILLTGKEISTLEPHERSKLGLFLAFQYPLEVPGVSFGNFLRLAVNAHRSKNKKLSVHKFRTVFREKAALLGFDASFMDRNLNEDFSGGEKKKAEILQLALIEPKVAILDETDSGLDVDALKDVFNALKQLKKVLPDMAMIIITHYSRVLDYLTPDKIHVMDGGKIVKSGGLDIAHLLDEGGYKKVLST